MENRWLKSIFSVSALALLALVTVSYRSGTLLGQATPTEYLVDNRQQGFSKQGRWYAWNSSLCLNGSCDYGTASAGTATWTFSAIPAGVYEVQGYWPTLYSLMRSVPVKVSDANGILENFQIHQQGPYVPSAWRALGKVTVRNAPVTITIDTKLSSGGVYVMADAFKLVAKGPSACDDEACQKQKIVSLIRSVGVTLGGNGEQQRRDALETAIQRATALVNQQQFDPAYDINGDGALAPMDINRLITYLNNGEGPLCGDGRIQPENAETCDDGNNASGDGCSAACVPECGDACIRRNVEALAERRSAALGAPGGMKVKSVLESAIQEGIAKLNGGRQDLQFDMNQDGRLAPLDINGMITYLNGGDANLCGNGALQPANQEACDDANAEERDACSAVCLVGPLQQAFRFWDRDQDGNLNQNDVGAASAEFLLNAYGTSRPDADFDRNGTVNEQDLQLLRQAYR